MEAMDSNVDACLERLKKSSFRKGFHLGKKEFEIIERRGIDTISKDCRFFIRTRLSEPGKHGFRDGRQTPWKGHPVFIAQHATATCCRGCLRKWYKIEERDPLSPRELDFIERLIMSWINMEKKSDEGNTARRSKAEG